MSDRIQGMVTISVLCTVFPSFVVLSTSKLVEWEAKGLTFLSVATRGCTVLRSWVDKDVGYVSSSVGGINQLRFSFVKGREAQHGVPVYVDDVHFLTGQSRVAFQGCLC